MDTNEFNIRFNIEYNNITSNAAPGLTLEEKSIFLTKAQETICLGIYNGIIGGAPFEADEAARRALSNLTKTVSLSASLETLPEDVVILGSDSKVYSLPSDIWFITYESAILEGLAPECLNPFTALVVPVTQDVYYKVHDNPFRGPSKDRVLRLDLGQHSINEEKRTLVELSTKYTIKSYLVRYMRRPLPIILDQLPSDSTIWGLSERTECELPESLHSLILQEAVKEAKATYQIGLEASTGTN